MTDEEAAAVQRLLRKYRTYKAVAAQERGVGSRLARAKLTGDPDAALVAEHTRLRARLRRISEGMTFANPLIWIAYKNRAYRREAQPILTVHDLRQHCRPIGYVCTKRFAFLNDCLVAGGFSSLADPTVFADDQPLPRLLHHAPLVALAHDQDFVGEWGRHEFHLDAGRVAKWEDYEPAAPLSGSGLVPDGSIRPRGMADGSMRG